MKLKEREKDMKAQREFDIYFTVQGEVPSLKNTLRFTRNGKPYHENDEVNTYKTWFASKVPKEFKQKIDTPVSVYLLIFKKDNRKDGQNISAMVYDCLQSSGIITNDRLVVKRHEWDQIDKKDPRVVVGILKS